MPKELMRPVFGEWSGVRNVSAVRNCSFYNAGPIINSPFAQQTYGGIDDGQRFFFSKMPSNLPGANNLFRAMVQNTASDGNSGHSVRGPERR